MASKYWIKIYHEILDDPKMGRMPDRLWRRTIELFLVAGEIDADGLLPKVGDMAYRLRLSQDELIEDLNNLCELNVIHQEGDNWIVTRFAERQSPVSDAERMMRYRDRQRKENYYGDEPVTNSVTKRSQSRIEENRKDIDKTGENYDILFQKAWEQETGSLVSSPTAFFKMLDEFIKVGVTPEIYQTAIREQKASGKYPVTNPTSVKNWAIGLVKNTNGGGKKRKLVGPDGDVIMEVDA